jgi:hypothetical protein
MISTLLQGLQRQRRHSLPAQGNALGLSPPPPPPVVIVQRQRRRSYEPSNALGLSIAFWCNAKGVIHTSPGQRFGFIAAVGVSPERATHPRRL